MEILFWMFAAGGWILLLIPLLKRRELKKENCRFFCRIGCLSGVCATICFAWNIFHRSQEMWNGDISERLYIAVLSVTMIPLGIYAVIFVITHILHK